MRLEVQLRDESIWLPQQKIADLFGVQKAAISKHLKNIYASGELIELATVPKWKQFRLPNLCPDRLGASADCPLSHLTHTLQNVG